MKIGLDFDGTVVTHEYPAIGKSVGAEKVLKRLLANGHLLNLNTMRSDTHLDEAVTWFKSRRITLNGVNEDRGQRSWTNSPKCFANLYIDDAGLGVPLVVDGENRPYVDWLAVESMLEEMGLFDEELVRY